FMESATDFFTIWDSELNLVDLNEASLRYPLIRLPAEVKKEDFIGRNILELEPGVKERGKYDQYLEVIKTGKPFFTEDVISHAKHGDVHLEVRAFKVGDGLGIVTADITERKRMEDELRESEEKLRIMFESIRDGITVYDLEGRIIEMNEAALRLHGFSNREELIGQNGLMLVAEKDRARARENTKRTFKEGRSGTVEYTLLTKGGEEFEAEYGGALVRDGFGKAVGFIGMTRDITERKRAEEALRESEEKLRYMFESIGDGVIVSDLEGNIVDVNEAELHMLGCSNKEEIIGPNGLQFIAEQDRDRAIEDMMKAVEVGYGAPMQYTFVGKDGREFDGEASAALLRDSSGSPVGFISLIRDITER
ncbi:MAG: PAS domain S-box protein, partial [Dehalococcoidia bacterium]|nr:PAS domain S-box protein [Dehalococcoidia bacterium]